MWLNHSKYCGFGEFSLFKKSQILGDFGVDLGSLWAIFGQLLVLWGSLCGNFADRKADRKFHSKTGAGEMRGAAGNWVRSP